MAERHEAHTEFESFDRLLAAARDGDRAALDGLIRDCRDYLLLVANQEMDQALQAKLGASDVVQQTLAEIPRQLDHFRGTSREEFLGWLRQALFNDLRDARRRYKSSQRRDVSRERGLQDSTGLQRPVVDPRLTPASQVISEEHARLLQAALQRLPIAQRKIIELRNWAQLSFIEIGKQLDMSPDSARKSWYRAIVKLQEILQPQFDSRIVPASLDAEVDDDPSQ